LQPRWAVGRVGQVELDPNEPTTRKVLPKTKGSTRKLGASPTTHGKFNIDVFFSLLVCHWFNYPTLKDG
jgi:hypothetical protein